MTAFSLKRACSYLSAGRSSSEDHSGGSNTKRWRSTTSRIYSSRPAPLGPAWNCGLAVSVTAASRRDGQSRAASCLAAASSNAELELTRDISLPVSLFEVTTRGSSSQDSTHLDGCYQRISRRRPPLRCHSVRLAPGGSSRGSCRSLRSPIPGSPAFHSCISTVTRCGHGRMSRAAVTCPVSTGNVGTRSRPVRCRSA